MTEQVHNVTDLPKNLTTKQKLKIVAVAGALVAAGAAVFVSRKVASDAESDVNPEA